MEVASTRSVRRTISVASIYYVQSVEVRFAALILLLWTTNTTSNISHARSALQYLAPRTVTTSMKGKFIAIITTLLNLLSDAMAVRPQS